MNTIMGCRRLVAPVLAGAMLLIAALPAAARLGETEAQSTTRYGEPKPQLISPQEQPLVVGATETAYSYQGWRIRVAFVDGVATRLEYIHIPGAIGTFTPITEEEVQAILEGEKGKSRWREQKVRRTGDVARDVGAVIQGALEGRLWERGDHAAATLKPGGVVMLLELPSAAAFEKKQRKQPAAQRPVPAF